MAVVDERRHDGVWVIQAKIFGRQQVSSIAVEHPGRVNTLLDPLLRAAIERRCSRRALYPQVAVGK